MSRVVVVTGASAGIGLAAATELAARGDQVVLLGRNPGRLFAAASAVRASSGRTPVTIRADFSVPDEVHLAAERVREAVGAIHVLANNAGGLFRSSTMQVNHLAGFVFTHLLLDLLQAAATPAAPARLITTASLAEAWGWLNVDRPMHRPLAHRSRWLAYGGSKQANLLFTVEAARRWTSLGVLATAFFPGLIRSRFAGTSPLFMLGKLVPVLFGSPQRGADTLVWLATAPPEELAPGGYYFMRQPFVATPRSTSPDRARRLWEASLKAAALPDPPESNSADLADDVGR